MASATFNHLCHEARSQALLDHKQRIELIKRDRRIDYPRATDAISRLERLPARHCGVINENTALLHHFLNIAQAQRVGHLPAHAGEYHFKRVVQPF